MRIAVGYARTLYELMTMTHVNVNKNNCRRRVNNLGGIFTPHQS